MHPCLTENDMGHFGQIVLNVLNAVGATQSCAVFVGPPEGDFVHPISFFQDFFCEAKSLEHLDRSTSYSICLTNL